MQYHNSKISFVQPSRTEGLLTDRKIYGKTVSACHSLCSAIAVAVGIASYAMPATSAEDAKPEKAMESTREDIMEEVIVRGTQSYAGRSTQFPLDMRELPQSVSQISRVSMDLSGVTDINDLMMNVTGINVTLYDSQRPLYFSRGFQITDFQVDGIPTYSGATNQEYDTALYESVEVIRGANGLITGVGSPSATVNLIRKRPDKKLGVSLNLEAGSWDKRRGVADVSVPLSSDGRYRSRLVVAYQDSDNFRDRYREDKTAVLGIVEGDITENTTVALGYQNQDNNPEGTIWGTIPIFAADGSEADLPVSTSFAPEWTQWQRESSTVFADVEHRFGGDWKLRGAINRTEGEVFSLRVYALGFPDRDTGEGMRLLAGVGETEDTRDSIDLRLTGTYSAFGRKHEVILGASSWQVETDVPGYTSISTWEYQVPDAWNYDGQAPKPEYSKTGAYRTSTTDQIGLYAANRFRITNALSLVGGARVTSWETGTDNFDENGNYLNTTGDYKVSGEITPYIGLVYDINPVVTVYTSYTDIFNPQSQKDKDNNLLEPAIGSNTEIGLKAELLNKKLTFTSAIFNTKQDNYAVRDQSQPDNSLPDGSSAFKGVDGTESNGVEFSVDGLINDYWTINAGYTYVDTERNENDRIWTNLPEQSIQASTHYNLPGRLNKLTIGGGLNWQSEIVGYGVSHPLEDDGVTYTQDSYTLVNFYATWQFNDHLDATFAATNIFDEVYWANIDYANYGEPRNASLSLRWRY